MALLKGGEFVEDTWRPAEADSPVPPSGGVVLSLSGWQAARDALAGSNQPIALRVEAGEMLDTVVGDLSRFTMIALVFPKFGDGRAFSKARLLREHGFAGEIRAVGDVLWDQLQLMARCGFDAFEITNEPTLNAIRAGKTPVMTTFYQPGNAPETRQGAPRAWARRSLA